MIPKQAIEKAIEGGWKPAWHKRGDNDQLTAEYVADAPHETALDPSFWQALARSLAWNSPTAKFTDIGSNSRWVKTAHHFYDLVLTGGDTEKFWEEILQ